VALLQVQRRRPLRHTLTGSVVGGAELASTTMAPVNSHAGGGEYHPPLVELARRPKKELPAEGGPRISATAYAKKIVDGPAVQAEGRTVQKTVVPRSTYDKIEDQTVAKQDGPVGDTCKRAQASLPSHGAPEREPIHSSCAGRLDGRLRHPSVRRELLRGTDQVINESASVSVALAPGRAAFPLDPH
jgi:hypothetical protein